MTEKRSFVKLVIVVVVLGVLGVLSFFGINAAKNYMSQASGGAREPKNLFVKVERTSTGIIQAMLSWQTEEDAISVIEYGINPSSMLLRQQESASTMSHKISLSPLKSDVYYYFQIRVGDEIYDNGGIPFSFKATPASDGTTPAVSPTGGQPTALPTIGSQPSSTPSLCVREEYVANFGSNNTQYDLNRDGVVNQLDWMECLKKGQPQTTPGCNAIRENLGSTDRQYDINKDGVVNTRDWVECTSQN